MAVPRVVRADTIDQTARHGYINYVWVVVGLLVATSVALGTAKAVPYNMDIEIKNVTIWIVYENGGYLGYLGRINENNSNENIVYENII